MVFYSIGHSKRAFGDFALLLEEHKIRVLADIRSIPASRHVPHFNQETLREALSLRTPPIHYVHLPELGGLRKLKPDSPNTAWKSEGFRAYADYMQTNEFEEGLNRLLRLSVEGPVAMLCAEAVPWKCHRMLVADALAARGHEVMHLLGLDEKW